MMKKMQKVISIAMLIVMILMVATTVVSAANSAAPNPTEFKGTGNDAGTNGIKNIGNTIITIVSTVGSIAAVIVLIVLGLKYMMGSAEEKAEYKKTLVPYIIGASLVFAASAIAGIIYGFASGFTG